MPLNSQKTNKTSRWSKKGNNLIFLLSLPRSGSTLLQRILAGHPAIFSLPEPWLMLQPAYMLKTDGLQAEYNTSLARTGISDFLACVNADEELLLESLRAQAAVLYKKALSISGKNIFLDKTPRYYHIIEELYRIFPQAQFIFLLRNPIAILSSTLFTWFKGDTTTFMASENYNQDMLLGPVKLLNGRRYLGQKAVTVRYEELIKKPQDTLKKLFNDLDLPYIQDIEKYGKHPFKQGRLGDHTGVIRYETPMASHADKWLTSLEKSSAINMALDYLKQLGPRLLNEFGYSYTNLEQILIKKHIKLNESLSSDTAIKW